MFIYDNCIDISVVIQVKTFNWSSRNVVELIIDCITIVKPWIVKQAKKKSQSDEVKLRSSGLKRKSCNHVHLLFNYMYTISSSKFKIICIYPDIEIISRPFLTLFLRIHYMFMNILNKISVRIGFFSPFLNYYFSLSIT